MKIADRIHLVGSGQLGFSLTDDFDCHVYLLDGGSEYALIDAGGGRNPDAILAQIEADGLDRRRIRKLLLTHAHADHAAGTAGLRERLDLEVFASPTAARYVREGDEGAISLEAARKAGVYPMDFVFRPCPVDGELPEGAVVRVGDLTLEVIDTPGHASGHISFILRRGGQTSLFCGDCLFFGGKILLQAIWDCSVVDSIRSVERLAALSIDGFYPGHLSFTVRNGRRQIDAALRSIASLVPPPQLL
ncbi:MAG TPA: MBL fold metallo-hydrolase [Chloroflexota bacterium]|nr:MBL fold metallo-hydrolase [Chloroflexota bacterium]